MATNKKKIVKTNDPASEQQTLSREELMKQPGWSNSLPGSPQTVKAKTVIVPEQINRQ
jgi:hypothetical protein